MPVPTATRDLSPAALGEDLARSQRTGVRFPPPPPPLQRQKPWSGACGSKLRTARTQIGHERTRVHACPLGASRPRSVTKVIPHALQDHDTDLIGRCRRAMVTAASAERRRATSPADLPAPPLPRSRDRPVLRGRCCRTPTGPWPRARSGTSGRPARTRRSGRDRAVRTPRVLARVTIEARCGGNSRRGQRPHASPSTNPRAIHHALARSGRYRSAALTRRNSGRSGRTE